MRINLITVGRTRASSDGHWQDLMDRDVFISYTSSDHSAAALVCSRIEERGFKCWIAPRDIDPSADWATAIVNALKACKVVVLIFSSSANDSRQVMREL